jgi:hypothetical protein
MPAMTQECCFSLDKLRLGNPKFPAVQIKSLSYDPFIDQIRLEYSFFSHPASAQQFPFMVATALGKYKTLEVLHEFDIRHPARYFPAGKFYSDIINLESNSDFLSHWMHGWFWLSSMNNETPDQMFNINSNLSEPLSFIPNPIIEPFNTDIPEDLIPVEAITWEYVKTGDMWRLTFEIDRKLIDPEAFSDCTLVFWILALRNQSHSISDPVLWALNETAMCTTSTKKTLEAWLSCCIMSSTKKTSKSASSTDYSSTCHLRKRIFNTLNNCSNAIMHTRHLLSSNLMNVDFAAHLRNCSLISSHTGLNLITLNQLKYFLSISNL